jgi:hypothetical protein
MDSKLIGGFKIREQTLQSRLLQERIVGANSFAKAAFKAMNILRMYGIFANEFASTVCSTVPTSGVAKMAPLFKISPTP